MTCEQSHELAIDVLYGEEMDSRKCFQFFKHLDECGDCNREYLEIIETREMLREWKVEEKESLGQRITRITRIGKNWWLMVQKVAAGFLIVVGAIAILQYMGYLGGRQITVSQPQLTQMVNDLIVTRQSQERQLIGAALVRLKEDLDLQRRDDMREVYNYLVSLERRYVENLEENNRYLKTLLSR